MQDRTFISLSTCYRTLAAKFFHANFWLRHRLWREKTFLRHRLWREKNFYILLHYTYSAPTLRRSRRLMPSKMD
jgi:hypothetical protein